MNTLTWILQLAYFMLPAYFANMAPILSRSFKRNVPLDFGLKFNGVRLLGDNKTLIGSIFGIIASVITAFVQFLVFQKYGFGFVDYNYWFTIGMLFGIGVIFGDASKSFFKRQMNIRPGRSWFPFDQIDFIIGSLIFISFFYFPGWVECIAIIIISAIGHICVNHCAFYLGIRTEKW